MSDDLSKSMEKLRKSTQRLNSITEDANHLVQSVEKFLTDANIGIVACVAVNDSDSENSCCYLEYRRVGTRFRIAVVYGSVDNERVKAWSEVSRDEKLETIVKLPELLVAISKKADEQVAKAYVAVNAVNQVLNSLES